jgi:hypothetical protein
MFDIQAEIWETSSYRICELVKQTDEAEYEGVDLPV